MSPSHIGRLESLAVQVLVLVHVEEVGRFIVVWVGQGTRICSELHYRMNVYVQLFGSVDRFTELIRRSNWEEGSAPADYWMDTPNHLYVITNTFSLCVVFLARLGSTTVLPLVPNMDGNAGTILIGFIRILLLTILDWVARYRDIKSRTVRLNLLSSRSSQVDSRAIKSNRAWGGITGATCDFGRGTNPCNYLCKNSVEWPEHKSTSLSIHTKVPRAIMPPQKYSSIHTSYCLAACVPPEGG
ncbi:hypothetical protein M9H77_09788 [Catharanthus roseus]|uniref:Uncharacterized protein n=1 Tax=Catharanthus roseus TaxID=4058 RepID=A0ACC0C260_CATRO|nr:hypothetical protein M9H77_09788 [Catharanthus roseus]